jgi:O-acetylhomoserine/O-acetylserine sulfhydrylase-like pyridoxal-dependent enzyme
MNTIVIKTIPGVGTTNTVLQALKKVGITVTCIDASVVEEFADIPGENSVVIFDNFDKAREEVKKIILT